jgi:hypothetical protein
MKATPTLPVGWAATSGEKQVSSRSILTSVKSRAGFESSQLNLCAPMAMGVVAREGIKHLAEDYKLPSFHQSPQNACPI